MARGIERRKIFWDDQDRGNFLGHLSRIFPGSNTACYTWVLIPNRTHLVPRKGNVLLAAVMRRLFTGYVVSFDRRHKRIGHPLWNQYKSIVCQENAYLQELGRYIHLNQARAGIVAPFQIWVIRPNALN